MLRRVVAEKCSPIRRLKPKQKLQHFSCSRPLAAEEFQKHDATHQASILSGYGHQEPQHRQATWLADPKVEWRTLLRSMQLGVLHVPAKQMSLSRAVANPDSASENHALVILGTPGFARHLGDDSSFIRGFLCKLNAISANRDIAEVDVLCAYVDGIGLESRSVYQEKGLPTEGISVLHGLQDKILPRLWDETIRSDDSSGTLSSLTFACMHGGRKVTMPLANTLFTNGRRSTLFISKWRRRGQGSFEIDQFSSKANQEIRIFENSGRLSIVIPSIPLTPARRIVSGLGNIIRQLEFGQETGPASRELESSIDEYFAITNKSKSAVAVWALIVPADLVQTGDLSVNVLDVKSAWTDDTDTSFIGRWIDKGATFCRVLSGGGGWGIKQGLLSLDPQTAYGTVNEPKYDYSVQSLPEQQSSALGNLATPGSTIQFFLAGSESNTEPKSRFILGKKGRQRSTVIETVPCTIDDISDASEKLSTPPKERCKLYPDHFGATSESGLYLETPIAGSIAQNSISKQHIVTTKIDLPYSTVSQDTASNLFLDSVRTSDG